jgi:hypothetical protein
VEAHADGDDRQADAAIAVLVGEDEVHRPGPEHEHEERDRPREGGHRPQRHADRARERLGAVRRAQPGQVGQERGLHGLEELQRRAADEQRVEDDARQDGAGGGARGEDGSVDQRLLGQLDGRHGDGEAGARPQGERPRGVVAAGPVRSDVASQGDRDHQEREQRRGGDTERDRRLAAGQADRDRDGEAEPPHRLEQHQAAVEPEPAVAGQVAAGEVAGGVGDAPRHEDPVQGRRPVEGVLDRPAGGQHDDGERCREPGLQRQRDPQRVAALGAERDPLRDRAREQLLDRAVDDRGEDEEDGPEQRDGAVLVVGQDVAGDAK